MNRLKVWRWLTLVFGILEIALGVWYLCEPQGASVTVAYIIPVAIICSGMSTLSYYFCTGKYAIGSGWILVDGLVAILFGLLVISSGLFVVFAEVVPYLFGLWAIFRGIFIAVSSNDLKLVGSNKWWVALVVGIVLIVIGGICFWNPTLGDKVIGILIGIYFILAGGFGIMEFYYGTKIGHQLKEIRDDNNKLTYIISDDDKKD